MKRDVCSDSRDVLIGAVNLCTFWHANYIILLAENQMICNEC